MNIEKSTLVVLPVNILFLTIYANSYRGICDVKEQSTKRTKGRFCKIYKFTCFKED